MVSLMVQIWSAPLAHRSKGWSRLVQQVVAPVVIATGTAIAMSPTAQAQDLSFTVYNETSETLMEFYTSPANEDSWGSDLLGSNVLGSGSSGTAIIADDSDQCVYDIQGVFMDDDGVESVVEDFGIDLCDLGSYTFTD